jgi:hypothetical protein
MTDKFLHNHPYQEKILEIDHEHVIVDKKDWEIARERLKSMDDFSKNWHAALQESETRFRPMTGAEMIAREREEQIHGCGRTVELDVKINWASQLVDAAIIILQRNRFNKNSRPSNWDEKLWDKMINKSEKQRIVIAGALLAAEYDRLVAIENKIKEEQR